MKPKPLVEQDGSELEKSLLHAARGYRPAPEAKNRALVALGISGAGWAAASSTAAATMQAAGKVVVGVVTWKSVGVAALVGGVGAGTWVVADPGSPPPRVVSQPVQTAPPQQARDDSQMPPDEPGAPVAEEEALEPEPEESTESVTPVDDALSQPAVRVGLGQRRAARPLAGSPSAVETAAGPEPVAVDELRDEVVALDNARQALDGRDSQAALDALDGYERQHGAGKLGLEAKVLRIEALVRAGEKDEAHRLGRAFLAQHPKSVHTGRVRALIR